MRKKGYRNKIIFVISNYSLILEIIYVIYIKNKIHNVSYNVSCSLLDNRSSNNP